MLRLSFWDDSPNRLRLASGGDAVLRGAPGLGGEIRPGRRHLELRRDSDLTKSGLNGLQDLSLTPRPLGGRKGHGK